MCDRIQPRQGIRFTPTTLAKWLSRLVLVLGVVCTGEGTVAQIVPDETLGNERSRLTPDADVGGLPADLIEGGAEREANLFHSFEQFNVGDGQRVYFANPAGIENILGRVTGGDVSDILGTLGVDGAASLFLLNPNGIVFGENARLDVAGSFVASTADSFVFSDGLAFSATNPEAPPLLTINVTPGLQYGTAQQGTIENAGMLEVGRDLTLSAGNLDLQGQLWAGGDLSLLAGDTVRVRDSAEHPFIAAARGKLLVQGNEAVDIFALNHADSGLYSGGDMVLRSAEQVGGDAHYWSGGSFRIEKLDGSLGDLFSPYDPIIFANGDLGFANYTGGSLHILAGGSVNVTGTITITGAGALDTTINPNARPELADVTLSDDTPLAIDGSARPTLDIRAGIDWTQLAGLPGNVGIGVNVPPGIFGDGATSADIAIDGIRIAAPDGVVFLTNQYEPNTLLPGGAIEVREIFADDIFGGFTGKGGSVILDSRRDLSVTDGFITTFSGTDDAGSITLLANEAILLTNSLLVSGTFGAGESGDAVIRANLVSLTEGSQVSTSTRGAGVGGELSVSATEIDLIGENPISGNPSALFAQVNPGATGMGGNLTVNTERLRVLGGATVSASTSGFGNAGDLRVVATDTIEVNGTDPEGNASSIKAQVNSGAEGRGGNLTLVTGRLLLSQGGQIGVSTFSTGDVGELQVSASEIELVGDNPISGAPTGLFARLNPKATGRGGNLTINTERLRMLAGASIDVSTFSIGDAGDLTVIATDSIEVSGSNLEGNSSGIRADVQPEAEGRGGNLTLETGQLLLSQGGVVSVGTFGKGNGGDLQVSARELEVTGTDPIDGSPSGLFARVTSRATGKGGNSTVNTERLRVLAGASVDAVTLGIGNAGDLTVVATDSIVVSGSDPEGNPSEISVAASPTAEGNGGDLTIETDTLLVQDGAFVSASSPSGQAGNLTVTADSLRLNQGTLFAVTGLSGSEEGANITLQDLDFLLMENESLITATALEDANGGNVTINADFIVAKSPTGSQGSDITANAVRGNGGRVSVTSNGLFGIAFRPQLTPLNDITVSSQFGLAGDFIDNTPGIDPSQGLATLPSNLVDPESLIDRSCTPGSAALQSSFIITGRGGIPTSPTDPLSSNDVVSEWVTLDTEEETTEATETPTHPTSTTPEQIIEAQGWIVNERGQVVLVANAPTVSPQTPRQTSPSCEDIRANAHE